MRIVRSCFVTSLERLGNFPGQGMPEIAMAGRSNVGKSSLINSLCMNSKLARTSSEPGKTRLVNIYRVNDAFMLTDLPGYGFAKAPAAEKKRWAGMIEGYLSGSDSLKHVFLLVDIRHEPTDDDAMMADYLRHYQLPFSVIATKADKLSKAARGRAMRHEVSCRKSWRRIVFRSCRVCDAVFAVRAAGQCYIKRQKPRQKFFEKRVDNALCIGYIMDDG